MHEDDVSFEHPPCECAPTDNKTQGTPVLMEGVCSSLYEAVKACVRRTGCFYVRFHAEHAVFCKQKSNLKEIVRDKYFPLIIFIAMPDERILQE